MELRITMSKRLIFTLSFVLIFFVAACQGIASGNSSAIDSHPQTTVVKTPTLMPSPTATDAPVPTATPTQPTCTMTTGILANIDIPSELLSKPVNANIYLPPCYDAQSDRTYPILYMLHGQAADNQQWIDLGLIDDIDLLIDAKVIQPMIIVMPYEVSWRTGPEESNFGAALVNEVIPFMEENYRVCAERACRAIGGLSRGGNWAVYLGFQYPEVFAAVGAHSAPLFYGELERIDIALTHNTSVEELPALYIDMGKKDENRDSIHEFVNTLKEFNVPYEFYENDGRHEAAYWSAHVTDYLLWYSKKLAKTNPDA